MWTLCSDAQFAICLKAGLRGRRLFVLRRKPSCAAGWPDAPPHIKPLHTRLQQALKEEEKKMSLFSQSSSGLISVKLFQASLISCSLSFPADVRKPITRISLSSSWSLNGPWVKYLLTKQYVLLYFRSLQFLSNFVELCGITVGQI